MIFGHKALHALLPHVGAIPVTPMVLAAQSGRVESQDEEHGLDMFVRYRQD